MSSFSVMKFCCMLFLACKMAFAHSTMTDPQSISPGTCRVGGEPQFGVLNCPGPCDLSALYDDSKHSNYDSPQNPARVFQRGEKTIIKYQRNNHGPGGFIRLTLVPLRKIMNKKAHKENAFHYSCWGAKPVVAKPRELGTRKGFTFIGSDGKQHDEAKGYYIARVSIPDCVPDGNYVLGWVWYGGVNGPILGNTPQEPKTRGYFGDYWACAFVRVQGGKPLAQSCNPVFKNDMNQFSEDGCMAANDEPGSCPTEPCLVTAYYRKPAPFNGTKPAPLTPANFYV